LYCSTSQHYTSEISNHQYKKQLKQPPSKKNEAFLKKNHPRTNRQKHRFEVKKTEKETSRQKKMRKERKEGTFIADARQGGDEQQQEQQRGGGRSRRRLRFRREAEPREWRERKAGDEKVCASYFVERVA
jgi:hypothetical protein